MLEHPISPEELHIAVRKEGRNKAPGNDGIGLEFYTSNGQRSKTTFVLW